MAGTKLTLTNPNFREGAVIPTRHTCEGSDVSPELNWTHVPDGTRSFALIVDDPDAPRGSWTHWILFDIPADLRQLPEGATIGTAGVNDFQVVGYRGPCPPPRQGSHRYFFKLHALDVESLNLSEGATREEVERAMEGHVIEQTHLMGLFERR